MSTSSKSFLGYAGEHLVICDLLSKHIPVTMPALPGMTYDVTADVGIKEKVDIQIKLGRHDGDKIVVDIRRSHAKDRRYSDADFDILAVADVVNKKVAYIPREIWTGRQQITLWKSEPMNTNGFGKGKQPLMFDDFSELEFIPHTFDIEEAIEWTE